MEASESRPQGISSLTSVLPPFAFLYGFNTHVCIPNSIKFDFWKLSSKNKTSCMIKRATLSLLKGSWGKNKLVSGSQFTNLQEPFLVKPKAWKTPCSPHRELWQDRVNCTLQRQIWRRPFCSSCFCAFWRVYGVKLVKILKFSSLTWDLAFLGRLSSICPPALLLLVLLML